MGHRRDQSANDVYIWISNTIGAITITATMALLFTVVLVGSLTALFASASIPARLIRVFLG